MMMRGHPMRPAPFRHAVMRAASAVLVLLASGLAAPAVQSQDSASQGLPAWMAGQWTMQDGAAWSDEVWTQPRGGSMIGIARSGFGTKLDIWEVTRIERKADGSISFFAQPRGGAAHEFPLALTGPESVEFVNGSHDYPQRIRYWRQGQLLMAEISLIDGSKVQRWSYRPVAAE